ncbi:MAG: hypothetical protein ACRCXZ_06925 [Patescibacteria group bacterium]
MSQLELTNAIEDNSLQPIYNNRFDFKPNQTKKNFKKTTILTIFLILLILSLVGLFTLTFFIPSPDLTPLLESKITNDDVVFASTSRPFYVKYNNKVEYSTKTNSVWIANLNKIEGKVTYKIGGYTDLGAYKVLGNNTKSITLERDYTGPKASIDIPKYVDSKVISFKVDLYNSEPVVIKNGDQLLYCELLTPNQRLWRQLLVSTTLRNG